LFYSQSGTWKIKIGSETALPMPNTPIDSPKAGQKFYISINIR